MLLLEQLATDVVKRRDKDELAGAVARLAKHLSDLKLDRLEHEGTINAARSNYAEPSDNDIEVDDEPMLSIADEGVWVSAWVWVPIKD